MTVTALLDQLKPYQANHLFILVGGNPLPCFVAARLLVKQDGIIYLVYSTTTKIYANALASMFPKNILLPLDDNERKPDKIAEKIRDNSKDLSGIIGLHYTGGTKVMAVHSYQTLLTTQPDTIFSYLDPHRLEICFERRRKPFGYPIKLSAAASSKALSLTLHQLWQLHNKSALLKAVHPKNFSERTDPIFPRYRKILTPPDVSKVLEVPELPGLAEILAQHLCDKETREQWINCFEGKDRLNDDNHIDQLPLDDVKLYLKDQKPPIQTIADLKARIGHNRSLNYLGNGGDWLEDLVLQYLKDLQNDLNINDIVCSAKTVRPGKSSEVEMELDVVAIRGYQLFIFSCYAGQNVETCKAKLYEAAMRAYQLGGSEARFALVCCYRGKQEDKHRPKQNLINQMSGTLSMRSFNVFDHYDIPRLKEEIRSWILEVDKEART